MCIRSLRAALTAAVMAGVWLGAMAPARAELGGSPMPTPPGALVNSSAPVARASSSAAASSSASAAASYTVRQTALSSGTVVREYIGANGAVFGIAWTGPSMPDLATLLGRYFPQVTDAVEAQRAQRGGGRGPASVEQSGLVLHSGGHPGLFAGQAYLPQALPAGVSGNDIQ